MLASTPAGPQWTYHQWVCLSVARAAPPSPCRVSLLDTVGTLFTAIPIVIASVYSVLLTVGGYGSTVGWGYLCGSCIPCLAWTLPPPYLVSVVLALPSLHPSTFFENVFNTLLS